MNALGRGGRLCAARQVGPRNHYEAKMLASKQPSDGTRAEFSYPRLVLPDLVFETIRLAVVVHRAVGVLHIPWSQDGRQGASNSR